ncbi:transposase family protein [Acinetobacter sp. MD2(2019)]|uniref:helix-turn-helix domain-containing protein n=1 Tax=Acinetobacter sp. MD2(2019) TaxID=2605273 RepID=UPI002D792334|nr:transposase family protein [Acinetobacter sp. MD2(2019)]
MKYIHAKTLSESQFKRLVGVKILTFSEMLDILKETQTISGRGRPSHLPLEDQLLMALSYWREYRTLFHTAISYGVHESSASRIFTKIENILIK